MKSVIFISVGARPRLTQCRVNEELDPLVPFRCENISQSLAVWWRVNGLAVAYCRPASLNDCRVYRPYNFTASRNGSVSELSLRPGADIRDEQDKLVECYDRSTEYAVCRIGVYRKCSCVPGIGGGWRGGIYRNY